MKSTDRGSYSKAVSRIRQKVFGSGTMGSMAELFSTLPFLLAIVHGFRNLPCNRVEEWKGSWRKRELTKATAKDSGGKYSPGSVGGMVLCSGKHHNHE